MLASGIIYGRHFKIRKPEPGMRIVYYLLSKESLSVLGSIPTERHLKVAKNIANVEGNINFYLLLFTTWILGHLKCVAAYKKFEKDTKIRRGSKTVRLESLLPLGTF